MARKRLARLPTAMWTPATVDWGGAWPRLEKALGCALSDDQRARISEAVGEYLKVEGRERAAPFVRDEAAWLAKLRAVAHDLHEVVEVEPARDHAARHGLAEVDASLDSILRQAGQPAASLIAVGAWLTIAIEAVERRQRPSDDGAAIVEGEEWRRLVRRMASLLSGWGLATGLRHDADGTDEKSSSFAKCFWELQQRFPPNARRHDQSLPALAKAMSWAMS